MLREAANKGFWLCFKNLHLVTSWLPLLEKELKSLRPHEKFRLWLTTEPHTKFPRKTIKEIIFLTKKKLF